MEAICKFHFRLVLAQNMLRSHLVSVLCGSSLAWKAGTKQCLQEQSRTCVVPQPCTPRGCSAVEGEHGKDQWSQQPAGASFASSR